MRDDDDVMDAPIKKKKKKPQLDAKARAVSYGIGVFLLLLGIGLLVWFYYTQRAPAKLFNLLAAGGIAAFLSGIGLFICPLDEARMNAFQKEPNPIAVFRVMPLFWKIWMLVILVGMIAGFVIVALTTERVR
jgi:cell division septal protein FtsQ